MMGWIRNHLNNNNLTFGVDVVIYFCHTILIKVTYSVDCILGVQKHIMSSTSIPYLLSALSDRFLKMRKQRVWGLKPPAA